MEWFNSERLADVWQEGYNSDPFAKIPITKFPKRMYSTGEFLVFLELSYC